MEDASLPPSLLPARQAGRLPPLPRPPLPRLAPPLLHAPLRPPPPPLLSACCELHAALLLTLLVRNDSAWCAMIDWAACIDTTLAVARPSAVRTPSPPLPSLPSALVAVGKPSASVVPAGWLIRTVQILKHEICDDRKQSVKRVRVEPAKSSQECT